MSVPGPLGDLVSTVHRLSDSVVNLKHLLAALLQREDQLIQMLPELDDVVQALLPTYHTLGLVFILCAMT